MIRGMWKRWRRMRQGAGTGPDSRAAIDKALQTKIAAGMPVLCNLGCGSRIHPDWINIDFHGDGKQVFGWDLRRGLPFPDSSCDVVYSSHAIEHFDRAGAQQFLQECCRILKRHGVIRLVAPDLEGVTRAYLSCLDAVRKGEAGAVDRYEWIVIELLDQLVRHRSGGEMLRYWCSEAVPAENFVAERVGVEYWRARPHCRGRQLADKPLDACQVGEFRLGGEVHQWMYDSYSLGKLLSSVGFDDIRACGADESSIPGFVDYRLDTEGDGSVYKPDSFFLEAIAP